jgi:nucleoid-associated protein YgaU
MALATVAANKRHLVDPQGNPFFALGINYSGYFDRAWKMWEADLYDPALIARDFRKAQNSGFNTIRLFAHPALLEDIRQDNFAKLDETLSLAQDHQLLVMLTLNDAHYLNLDRTSQLDAKIVERYQDVPTIFAYDLENEPVFYNLVAAVYPENYRPPVHTSQLVDHYGQRVSREETVDLQSRRRIPGHLDEETAFYYINALRLFLEYDAAVRTFVKQGRGTLVDFILSDEAEPWHVFIEALDGTVESWLQARMEPIRAAGCRQLLTVGWNWLHFAGLSANRVLDFQSYHNYTTLSMSGFKANVAHLESLRRAFPQHPIIFAEFGWSNQSGTSPANSRPVEPKRTALYEAATYVYLRANAFGGGFKWMLNDVQGASNPYEASFGVFRTGDEAKSIRDLAQRFHQHWPSVDQEATFTLLRDVEAGISYRFDLPQQITVGGSAYQDEAVGWQADEIAHCFIEKKGQELFIDAQGSGRLSIDPWDLIPTWDRAREADLYRVFSERHRTRQNGFKAGESVVVDVRPGAQYAIAMGIETAVYPPPEDAVQVDPKPGEHVLLFGDFENYVHAALKYLRRFAPDFTFAVNQVAGRWPYVSVVATPDQISDEILDNIRGSGAVLVERVVDETPEATQMMLTEMAQRGQRFLTAIAPPPQEEPPPDPGETPPAPHSVSDTYVVQPGDTLGKIAKQVYGDFRLWKLIFEANRDKISDPGLIRVGMELHLPEKE